MRPEDRTSPLVRAARPVEWRERVAAAAEARAVLEHAQATATQERRLARERIRTLAARAIAAGRLAGRQQAARQVAEAVRFRLRARESLVPELAQLARQLAERVLRAELELQPEAVIGLCRQVLAESAAGRSAVLRLHPGDAERFQLRWESLVAATHGELKVMADPAVAPGGCVVEGTWGRVDAGLAIQLDALESVMNGARDARG